ncbi:MAG: lipoate--protein ligase, partial [Eubacterium sp.]|nr:lipoate--protein ligase [Eubacterium sp.]
MIYAESLSTDPYWNLAFEEFLFEKLPSEEVFYLCQNSNTVVVGKYQNTAEEINHSYASEQGIRVVRRLSGGGAVYHDEGNLNYSFIVNQPDVAEIFD